MARAKTADFSIFGGTSATTVSGAEKFPNPFLDIASTYVPTNISDMFDWSEYIFNHYGIYSAVCKKVVRYFITEVVLENGDKKTRDDFEDYLTKKLKLPGFLGYVGDNYMVYGNVFISFITPFIRFIICPKCGVEMKEEIFPGKFNPNTNSKQDPVYTGTCPNPKCNYTGNFKVKNRADTNKNRAYLKAWNPRHIKLKVHPITDHIEYYLELDPKLVQDIRKADAFTLKETPWEMVVAACSRDKLFKFKENAIYHIAKPSLTGVDIHGWGIPPLLAQFKLCYYIQLLRRYDEAIAFDYIIPFRIISPDNRGNQAAQIDPLMNVGMGGFAAQMRSIIDRRRQDPTSIAISPFPVQYQANGGEGASLAPKDNIALATDELLNSMGFPAELFKGSLNIQTMPAALRLFERSWGHIVDEYNGLIGWLLNQICTNFNYKDITGSLRSVTLADDMERKAIFMQLNAGMKISDDTAISPYGLDSMEEQKKMIEEQRQIQDLQQKAMEEQEAASMGAETQGTEEGPGGQPGATPGDVHEQAKQLAYQLLVQTPESQRKGELIRIKHSNPTLHAMVKQEMVNLRQQMQSTGYQQQLQMAQQGGMQ